MFVQGPRGLPDALPQDHEIGGPQRRAGRVRSSSLLGRPSRAAAFLARLACGQRVGCCAACPAGTRKVPVFARPARPAGRPPAGPRDRRPAAPRRRRPDDAVPVRTAGVQGRAACRTPSRRTARSAAVGAALVAARRAPSLEALAPRSIAGVATRRAIPPVTRRSRSRAPAERRGGGAPFPGGHRPPAGIVSRHPCRGRPFGPPRSNGWAASRGGGGPTCSPEKPFRSSGLPYPTSLPGRIARGTQKRPRRALQRRRGSPQGGRSRHRARARARVGESGRRRG